MAAWLKRKLDTKYRASSFTKSSLCAIGRCMEVQVLSGAWATREESHASENGTRVTYVYSAAGVVDADVIKRSM